MHLFLGLRLKLPDDVACRPLKPEKIEITPHTIPIWALSGWCYLIWAPRIHITQYFIFLIVHHYTRGSVRAARAAQRCARVRPRLHASGLKSAGL